LPRVALVCGNGLSISRAANVGLDWHPSYPFGFTLSHPGRSDPLIESLRHLRDWIWRDEIANVRPDFAKIDLLLEDALGESRELNSGGHLHGALMDLRHYLALAYSAYQLRLDRQPDPRWPWHRWLRDHATSLVCALSWNYDLVLEAGLRQARAAWHYAGVGGWAEWNGRAPPPRGLPVSKPHGSCNFVIDGLSMNWTPEGETASTPFGYSRPVNVAGVNAPLTVLPDARLYTVRQLADVIVPGEINAFGTDLRWMQLAATAFRRTAGTADTLVIIGFRMSPVDQPEFESLLSWVVRINRVIVADPDPNPALLDLLAPRTASLERWVDGPRRI
jgi:hypothetical protein